MNDELLLELIDALSQIEKDNTIPRNVRSKVKIVCSALGDNCQALAVRIDKSLQELDEVGNDPNVPIYAKTKVWNVVSQLEGIQQ